MIYGERTVKEPVRWGMVGGGHGSMIGYIHRSAALRDFSFRLVAGAFDLDPQRGREFGIELHVDGDRCYPDYKTMLVREAERPDGIQAVTVATPNSSHHEICKAALQAGLHVVCEKPLCFTLVQALELQQLAKEQNRLLGVTYGYSGYQTVEEARQLIASGELGEIRMINMQFAHSGSVEREAPGSVWRTDPKYAGPSYVLGDLGTHPLYLSQVMAPQLKIKRLMCTRQSFVKSRAPLEDNAYTIMEYDTGAMGTLWSSAVNAGATHSQKVRVTGDKASLEWWDERPNQLLFEVQGKPQQVLERGMGYLSPQAKADDRIAGGHPEGLFEAWSNLYSRFARVIAAKDRSEEADFWYPDAAAGVEGVRWVEHCVRSADNGAVWVDYQ